VGHEGYEEKTQRLSERVDALNNELEITRRLSENALFSQLCVVFKK